MKYIYFQVFDFCAGIKANMSSLCSHLMASALSVCSKLNKKHFFKKTIFNFNINQYV